MNTPETVTVGVVLYGPEPVDAHELEQESARASAVAQQLGAKNAFGQAIAMRIPKDIWTVVLARQNLPTSTELLASVHFFTDHLDPVRTASALAVFAQAWRYRREHGMEPTGAMPLADLPPGPLSSMRTLREAADVVNALTLDDGRFGEWMRAYEARWGGDPGN